MLVAFNLILLALVLLIAYWWANQGIFSGLLHLICVIVSGAIALAFWEPLTLVFLKVKGFENFAWAVSLILLFVIPLAILRLATNKLVPSNVDLPHWANLTFGFPIGLCSGILSMGILLIGTGFVQGHLDIMGYKGYARDRDNAKNITHVGSSLWIPVHEWTYEFYSLLSVTSLSTNQPLRQYYPDVHKVAWSQYRDTFREGRGQVSITPNAATIEAVNLARDSLNRCMVVVKFNSRAMDYGEQLTISSSQVRLVSKVSKANRTAKPHVAHPARWNQAIRGSRRSTFLFDDITNYATSVEGTESTIIAFDFEWPVASDPLFIQIKGIRFTLPRVQLISEQDYEPLLGSSAQAARTTTTAVVSKSGTGRLVTDSDIIVTVSIRPLMISRNMLPGEINITKDNYLTEGFAEFPRRAATMPARALRIKGIYEPEHTKIIQVHVKRGGQADIFGPVRQQAGNNATPVLVDSNQTTYSPIGYIYDRGEIVDVKLFPTNRELGELNRLPQLSSAGGLTLRLIYRVSEGVQIVSFRLGDVTVATCNVQAVKRN